MRFLVFIGFASLAGAWTAYKGIRASDEELRRMANVIGTRNPKLARVVCWGAFVPLTLVGGGIVGCYLAFANRYVLGIADDPAGDFLVAVGCGGLLAVAGVISALTRPSGSGDSDIPRPLSDAEEEDPRAQTPKGGWE